MTAAALRPSRVRSRSVASTARVVGIEGEEDAGTAPEGGGDPLDALGAQGSDGRKAPSGKGEPVEQALGHYRPRQGRGRACRDPAPAWGREGPGSGASGRERRPDREPADEAAGGVGNDDHAGEPLRTPLHEQPGVPDALLGEAEGLQGLPQPAARRIAETEAGCGDRADAPRGQVLPRFCVTPEPSGVEARRRRQQCGVPGSQRGGPRTPRSGWTNGGPGRKPGAAVQPRDGLRQRQPLGLLDEVQHVAAQTAAEAVEPLRIGVHREAALHLVVEGADALADPAPSPEPHSRRLHRVAQRVPGLQRGDVHVGRHHHAPPARGRSPRRLRPETTLPGRQRIPRTAATSSVPSPWGTSADARPVPWL